MNKSVTKMLPNNKKSQYLLAFLLYGASEEN